MPRNKKSRIITYREAINEALHQEMASDPRIFVYGLDVADHKRTFGSGNGLLERFGSDRYFSTPLAEDALMGFGLGAALNGMKPVYVHIRIDFLLLAMNQLVNMVAAYRYGTGGAYNVPIVIRAVIGRGWGQGFQHSKTLHAMFAHIPGLKVIMPTTPYDAKGLLIAALRDENPVLILEHRWLYWAEGNVPEESYMVPIGRANVLRKGKHCTIVATSWMNVEAMRAAEVLAKRNIHLEIIDPRSIWPLDDSSIVASVKKTGHCIVADYDWVPYGFGSEVAARVSEKCFGKLKTPVVRLGFAHTPCPTTRVLEDEFYPTAYTIIRAVETMFDLKKADLSHESFYNYENKFKGPF